jgi:TRAP-type C4-dicarboxylate transport system permease small subunit
VIVEAATLLGIVIMVVTTLIGVIDRFIIGSGQPWPEEAARFTLIWTSLLASAVAAKRGQHYRLSFIYDRLGRHGAAVIDLICIAALLVVCWYGISLVLVFNGQTSPALGLPMSYVYAAVPVSSALMAWYMARNLVAQWRRPSPEMAGATR